MAGSVAMMAMPAGSSAAGTTALEPVKAGSGGDGATSMNTAGQDGQAGEMAAAGQGAMDETTPYHAEIVVPDVLPGEEGTVCVQVRLDNTEAVNVVRLHNKLSLASHHFILSKVTDPLDAEQELAPCVAFRGAIRGAPISITQKHDDPIELPDGVAYNLEPNQLLSLELHYLNAGTETTDVKAETNLYAAPAGESLQEATVMLIGTGEIAIAPRTSATSGPKYTEMPPEMNGVSYFAITGHTHRFGTNVQVSSAANDGDTGTLLYAPEPFIWDAPEMVHYEPAVKLPSGGGFRFECEWNNPTDDVITFGESALQEMCFFWAYYYPKKPVTNVLLDGVDLGPFLGSL